MQEYLVCTGIVVIRQQAETAREAIAALKARIDARRHETMQNPVIGMSLVDALDAHRLNFIVMDTERTALLCGELNWFEGEERMSRFEEPVSRRLADALKDALTPNLYYTTDYTTA